MKTREMLYAVLVVLGVLLPMYYNVQYMQGGGNLIAGFLTVPMENAVTASLLFDLLTAVAAYNVLLLTEGRSPGGKKLGLCLAVSWLVSFAVGLPLFLLLRERQAQS